MSAKDLAARVVGRVPPRLLRRWPAGLLVLNRALKRQPRAFARSRTRDGFVVAGHTSDLIQRYLHVFGVWEPNLTAWLRGHLREGDVVVDVGANVGYFSLLAATRVGRAGRVLAFEPVPSIADALDANVRRSALPVEVHRTAVGDEAGSTEVFRSAGTNLGRSGTAVLDGTSEGTVTVVRGADAVPAELWPRVRFVKVDVEGDERAVLRGLEPLLRVLPEGAAVFTEVTPSDLERRGESADELLATMRELGFTPFAVPNSYAPADYARSQLQEPLPLYRTPATQTDVLFLKTLT